MTKEEAKQIISDIDHAWRHFSQKEYVALGMAIKALNQETVTEFADRCRECGREKVLDKIRAEIEALSNSNPSYWHSGDMVDRDDVLEIIDKYRSESEDKTWN